MKITMIVIAIVAFCIWIAYEMKTAPTCNEKDKEEC